MLGNSKNRIKLMFSSQHHHPILFIGFLNGAITSRVFARWMLIGCHFFFSSLTTPYCQYFDFYHHLDHVDNLCHWNLRSLCYGRKDHTIVCTCTILPSHDVQFFTSIYTGQFTETAPPKTEPKAHRICRLCKEQLCQRAFTV